MEYASQNHLYVVMTAPVQDYMLLPEPFFLIAYVLASFRVEGFVLR